MLPLKYLPDPVLRKKTRRVKDIDASLLKLIDDMIETMQAVQGVGLAANQVGQSLRVAVVQVSPDEEPVVLINPKIVRREGEREVVEGCLSIPGYQGMATRSAKVRVRALDRSGKEFRMRAGDDLMAQALEHEVGHLEGELYIDHLTEEGRLWKPEDEAGPEQEHDGNAPVESNVPPPTNQ